MTILLFTKDRPQLATEVIKFWSVRDARVLVLDASTTSAGVLKKQCQHPNVTYFFARSFWERALYAANNIDTQFAIIHSDDSITFPKGINKAIQILKCKDLSYIFSPANFTRFYLEKLVIDKFQFDSEIARNRLLKFAKAPNDNLWGAVWKSRDLSLALEYWAESVRYIKFETGLHTVSLYLVGCFVGKGQGISETIHASRHWLAPVDESMAKARSATNVYLLENTDFNNRLFEEWKSRILFYLNKLHPITIQDLEKILNYLENSREVRIRQSKIRSFIPRLRQKISITIKSGLSSKNRLLKVVFLFLNEIRRCTLLSYNCIRKKRIYFRLDLLEGMSQDEIESFGITLLEKRKLLGEEKHFYTQH